MQIPVELRVHGLTLRGMAHRPSGGDRRPAAAIYHGFTGNKMEPHFLLVKLSRALAAAGLASVRFDFGGSGESDGEFVRMTLSGEVEEARAILEFTRSLPWVDPSRVFVVGLSMGGAIASIVAGDAPDWVRAAVLWAPAGNMPELFLARDPSRLDVLRREGRVDLGGLWLGREFAEDLAGWDIYSRAARYPGRVLVLHGDQDQTVPLAAALRYKEIYGCRCELAVISGADHTFNRCDWEEEVIRRTVDFLRAESGANSG
ncbi:MAG: alpha/beta hydrolase family protein [Bacteroidota bacterium]